MNRRLYRCNENRVLAGVASGVAEFFGIDPTLVRVLWFLSIFVGGLGILVYIGLALIVPLEPAGPGTMHGGDNQPAAALEGHRHEGNRGSGRISMYLGITLIVVGGFALLQMALPGWMSWRQLGPVLIVLLGAFLVFGATRRDPAVPAATAGTPPPPPVAADPSLTEPVEH